MVVKISFGFGAVAVLGLGLFVSSSQAADGDQLDKAMAALKPFQTIVGRWEGSGQSDSSKGWDEDFRCTWKFSKSGKVSLYMYFDKKGKAEGRLLDEALIRFDPKTEEYRFYAYMNGSDTPIKFKGQPKTENNLIFVRYDKAPKAKDKLDKLDLKIINDGDRVVYTFSRRIGAQTSKRFKSYSMVMLNRQGASFAGGGSKKPVCIVSGGLGTMSVSFQGKSYPVCCTGCQAMFNEDPERWLAKLKNK